MVSPIQTREVLQRNSSKTHPVDAGPQWQIWIQKSASEPSGEVCEMWARKKIVWEEGRNAAWGVERGGDGGRWKINDKNEWGGRRREEMEEEEKRGGEKRRRKEEEERGGESGSSMKKNELSQAKGSPTNQKNIIRDWQRFEQKIRLPLANTRHMSKQRELVIQRKYLRLNNRATAKVRNTKTRKLPVTNPPNICTVSGTENYQTEQ